MSNEAAERLRIIWHPYETSESRLLDEALAAERRATVERIRERLVDLRNLGFTAGGMSMQLLEYLDEEAAR